MKTLELNQMEKISGGLLVCMEPVFTLTGMCIGGRPCPPFMYCIM